MQQVVEDAEVARDRHPDAARACAPPAVVPVEPPGDRRHQMQFAEDRRAEKLSNRFARLQRDTVAQMPMCSAGIPRHRVVDELGSPC
eukprot:3795310-Pyramimonas_sp.AAC.1